MTNVLQYVRGDNDMISVRLNEELEKDIKEVANFEGMSVSDFIRNALIEKIEDYFDYKDAKEALEEFEKSGRKTYTYEEVFGEKI